MPEAFNRCVRNGGKVRTRTLPKGRYQYICVDKKGNVHAGEVHKKKKEQQS